MRFAILILAILIGVYWISNAIESGPQAQIAMHQAEAQVKRDQEQRDVLVRLEAKNDAKASELANDWRKAYPIPTEEDLANLRLVEQRINNDITSAASLTTAAKQAKADALTSQFGTVLGSVNIKAKPGL